MYEVELIFSSIREKKVNLSKGEEKKLDLF